jgi:threonine/homoserine/homoserine lactone efflux protein
VVSHYAAFLAIAAIVIVTPGPDTALTIRNTLVGGRRNGVLTAIGVVMGQATWTLAASVGLVALLRASQPAFMALKLAGAAYLVFLGAASLVHALRRGRLERVPTASSPIHRPSPISALRQGLVSNLGNPKIAVFFTSLLPQFASSDGNRFLAFALLGITFVTMTLAWLTVYTFAVARAGDFLRRTSVQRVFESITGGILMALGVKLALEHE